MKIPTLILATATVASAELDLTTPYDYEGQTVPAYITRDNTAGNPITNLGATLGRVLFYDKRLSKDGTVSCSSCHQQEHGFSDTAIASSGVAGSTGRHSMRLVNARFGNEVRFFWDERATSLEDQTTKPIQDHTEMGFSGTLGDPDFSDLVAQLSSIKDYHVLFTAVNGEPGIDEAKIQNALAQFVRSIQSFDTPYDVGRQAAGNDGAPFPNFTASENAGKQLFLAPPGPGGGAGCAGCHQPPEFSIDPNSGNNGIVGVIAGGTDFTVTRSPGLRDLVDPAGNPNGGFMHTAQFATLEQVIAHYNAIPAVVTGLDPRLTRPGPGGPQPQRLNLSAQQQADLVAFMRTLTGSAVYTDPKWSDPFDEEGALGLVVLPSEGIGVQMSGEGPGRTITVSMNAVPNVPYVLQWSDNMVDWYDIPVTANEGGLATLSMLAPEDEDHCYYRFAYLAEGL